MFSKLSCDIKYNEPLKNYTSWHVGGPCKALIKPRQINEVNTIIQICREYQLPFITIGKGSNILVDDSGFDGIVIHLANFKKMLVLDEAIYVEAGFRLPKLAFRAAKCGVAGFDFYAGIPGTVGGAVVMNAGSAGKETKDIIKEVTYINEKGQIVVESVEDLKLGFRKSKFLNLRNNVILSAKFHVSKANDPEEPLKLTNEIFSRRKRKFPLLNVASAGSTFKSPSGGPYPGRLIEEVGLKGYRIGGAQISKLHGNWIINNGDASAKDIKSLIDLMQNTVRQKLGVEMEREVLYV